MGNNLGEFLKAFLREVFFERELILEGIVL